jgi:Fe-S cluster assembly protein SufD
LAAYFGDGTQMHDFRTLQEHGAPRTKSDLVFKGAVGGTARSVYSGLIRMRHGAKGADAFQTNRNLVLSDGAHADSVPNLDIEENDVRCSHASAIGQIDREQRFYLESRGVPPAVAERLILLGFFEDLWVRIAAPGVRDHLAAAVAARLDGVTGGG